MSIGRLCRHLDADLIHRIEGGWKPKDRVEPLKRKKAPRLAETYRGARRGAVLRGKPKGVWQGAPATYLEPPAVRPNKRQRVRIVAASPQRDPTQWLKLIFHKLRGAAAVNAAPAAAAPSPLLPPKEDADVGA